MGALAKVLSLITLIPGIVQGIETIHGNAKSGADKKTLALQSLGLAGAVAASADPAEQANITAVTNFAGNMIDQTVALFNQTGWAHKS